MTDLNTIISRFNLTRVADIVEDAERGIQWISVGHEFTDDMEVDTNIRNMLAEIPMEIDATDKSVIFTPKA